MSVIFSKQHQLLFIKPQKCASTSVEMFLEASIWPDRNVTHDTNMQLLPCGGIVGYRGVMKFRTPPYYNHMPLSKIQGRLGTAFEFATKVSVIRCPIEKAVSLYFHIKKHQKPRASFFGYENKVRALVGKRPKPLFDLSTDEENILRWIKNGGGVDDRDKFFLPGSTECSIERFIRYPFLVSDLRQLAKDFELSQGVEVPHVKRYTTLTSQIASQIRKDARKIMNKSMQIEQEIYDAEMQK